MRSIIESGEMGYKLPEQILFNFPALFPTLLPDHTHLLFDKFLFCSVNPVVCKENDSF